MSIKYSAAAFAYRKLCEHYARLPLAHRIVLLSRQTNFPSQDFRMLAHEFERDAHDWNIEMNCYLDSGSFSKRLKHSNEQARLVATAELVVVDGWNPAVSIPKLRPETHVVQLWHGFGAVKQFGWQIVGKPYGRTRAQATQLHMHRNYDCIIAAGPGALDAYAQAFDTDPGRIVTLGVPSMDWLSHIARDPEHARRIFKRFPAFKSDAPKILYAPTFRKGDDAAAIVSQSASKLALAFASTPYRLVMVSHPVFSMTCSKNIIHVSGVRSAELMPFVDYVITDYSSVALEAGFIGKKTLFYTPDIDDYRQNNGLNIDPQRQFTSVCFTNANKLAAYVERDMQTNCYGESGFETFCRKYFDLPRTNVTESVASYIVEHYLSTC